MKVIEVRTWSRSLYELEAYLSVAAVASGCSRKPSSGVSWAIGLSVGEFVLVSCLCYVRLFVEGGR